MKRAFIAFLVFFFLAPALTWSQPFLRVEPAIEARMEWDLTANGMLYVGFDLDANGKSEFYTVRIVEKSFASRETIFEVGANFPRNIIFFVNQGSYTFYYIASSHPVFYAADVNEDGMWDLIYKDALEDGVNGNETFYDSPSGMFGEAVANF